MWLWACQIAGPLFWQVSLGMNCWEAWHGLTALWQGSASYVHFLSKLTSESPSWIPSQSNMRQACQFGLLSSSLQRQPGFSVSWLQTGGTISLKFKNVKEVNLLNFQKGKSFCKPSSWGHQEIQPFQALANYNSAFVSTVLHLKNGHENKIYLLDLFCGCNVITHVMFLGCCLILAQKCEIYYSKDDIFFVF